VERWEPPFNGTPSLLQQEDWNQAPFPFVAFLDAEGNPLRNNPWIEAWEPAIPVRDERFQYTDSFDVLGNEPIETTESLVWAYQPSFITYASAASDPGVERINPPSYYPPVTLENGGLTTFQKVLLPSPYSRIVGNLDYQRTTVNGIPAPANGFRKPLTLPTGGPGGTSALQFLRNGTNPSQYEVKQGFKSTWGIDWAQHDFTLNFWMYQSQKGTNHRPFCMAGYYDNLLEGDDNFLFFMWWDKDTDQYEMVVDYFDEDGAQNVAFNDMIDAMQLDAGHLPHTGLGSPSLNQWYMHTIRWDLSDLDMRWTINSSTTVNVTLGGAPTAAPFSLDFTPLRWMAMYRNYQTNIVPDAYGMNGRFAQPSLWARELSDAEVTAIYNSGTSAPYPYEA